MPLVLLGRLPPAARCPWLSNDRNRRLMCCFSAASSRPGACDVCPLVEHLESAARGSINLGGEQVVAAHQTSHAPPHELVYQPVHRDVREVIREMHVQRRDRAPRLLRVDVRVRALLLLRRPSLKGFGAAIARVFLPEGRRGDARAFVPVRVAPLSLAPKPPPFLDITSRPFPWSVPRALLPVLVPVETDIGVVLDEELDDVVGASGVLGERRRVSLGAAQAEKERAKRGRDVPDASREGGGLVRIALRSRHPSPPRWPGRTFEETQRRRRASAWR